MANGSRPPSAWDALGLIILYALAMAALTVPYRWLTLGKDRALPFTVNASQKK